MVPGPGLALTYVPVCHWGWRGAPSDVLLTGIDAPIGLRVDADTQATGLGLGQHEERGYDL